MDRLITKEIKDLDVLIGKNITKGNNPKGILNHTQMQILLYLFKHQNEDVCQKDLEIETHLKKASITGTLDSMQDKGIIERKQSEDDKRKNIIVLSKKTLDIKEKIEDRFKEIEISIKKGITEEELNNFFKVVEKIKANLNKEG